VLDSPVPSHFWVVATFHVRGTVKKYSCVWGNENHYDVTERERDSPKFNMWRALMKNKVIGPFVFEEPTMDVNNFLACSRTLLCYMFLWEQFSS
jgi:hypothetical protein